MQCVTMTYTCYHTRYHTFSLSFTWVGLNAMRCHNFNALPRALPYIFFEISLFLGYLQRVTTRYCQFFEKNINIHFLYKFDGNAW